MTEVVSDEDRGAVDRETHTPVDYKKNGKMIDDIKLIAEIKNHPLLYDPGVPENRDMNAKESTWTFIAKSLGYSVRECKMRWKSLRERFARERKKIILSNVEYGSDDEHEKDGKAGTWHLMKHMSFLWNFVFHRNINRSRSMFLNAANEEHMTPVPPASAPIWLLPNMPANNILQALQNKSITPGAEESGEYTMVMQVKNKDPLCVDEENSICFDVDSSDSEKESKISSKRTCDEDTRTEMVTSAMKKMRREMSPGPNDLSTTQDRCRSDSRFSPVTSDSGAVNLHVGKVEQNIKPEHMGEIEGRGYSHAGQSEFNPRERSDDELFCLSIAASMQRLSAKQRALLKLKIQQVMYEVEFPE
ncbi:hypothetical protein J437_LFUL004670 [Ladona fulva]|uniref:Transcription factor Adf-1 n=1 Tax=Ladona fulva TaxID=123851 RepID=A0A8K0K276_LADFU|nr:hypothetical protein J437_LFUL004670 [Ladona fulva]